jgi:hypothetical protein
MPRNKANSQSRSAPPTPRHATAPTPRGARIRPKIHLDGDARRFQVGRRRAHSVKADERRSGLWPYEHRVTLAGIRAVDHAVEDICSINGQPVAEGASYHALRRLGSGLAAVKADPLNLEARLDCQIGAWMSMVGSGERGQTGAGQRGARPTRRAGRRGRRRADRVSDCRRDCATSASSRSSSTSSPRDRCTTAGSIPTRARSTARP